MMVKLIGLACLSFLIAEGAEPLEYLKQKIRLERFHWINKLLTCSLCCGFWVGLMGTQNILNAAIVSVCAETISRINKKTIL